MSVRRAQQEIDSREFAEWIAYEQIDPSGAERTDLNAGIIASTIANVWRGKGQKTLKPSDFMPDFGIREPKSWESLEALFRAGAQVHNESLKRNDSNR